MSDYTITPSHTSGRFRIDDVADADGQPVATFTYATHEDPSGVKGMGGRLVADVHPDDESWHALLDHLGVPKDALARTDGEIVATEHDGVAEIRHRVLSGAPAEFEDAEA